MTHIQQFVGSSSGGISASAYTTQNKSADFTAAAGFLYLIDSTSATVTVTLPSANISGQTFAVKWSAGTNAVTLNRAGSDTIGPSATTATIDLSNEVWEFVSSGSGQWNLIRGNKTLSSLDARFYAPALPADRGFLAWAYPPYAVAGSTALASAGVLFLTRIRRVPAGPVTNINIVLSAVGATLTTGQCFAALYTAAGAKIDVTADQAANWTTGIGLKTMALAGGAYTHTGGDLYGAVWYNGTTGPALYRQGQLAGMTNAGLAAPNLQSATASSSVTTTAPNPFGSQASAAFEYWMALS